MVPVGTREPSPQVEAQCARVSASSNSPPPMSVLHRMRLANVRAPSRRASTGAASPTKATTPTRLTTVAVISTTRNRASARISPTLAPSELADDCPSCNTCNGRISSNISTEMTSTRGHSSMNGPQLFCTREPAPQMKRLPSHSPLSSRNAMLRAPRKKVMTRPARITVTGEKPSCHVRAMTIPMAMRPPAMATRSGLKASKPGANSVATVTPNWPPASTPRVVGEARGLPSTCWVTAPASPRPQPIRMAMDTRGAQLK